jgi:type III secretion protein V
LRRALHSLLAGMRGSWDVVFAFAVLALVVLLVAPLSPALLDVCLALNLGLATVVLVVTLFARDALRFASFPTLLLLTTLLRLVLNVSSTRLVLSRGDAGRIIRAFGQVVVQGNYVVGAVVFAIVTLVQLLVVAKGAERVAEVTARFVLDALPGKQMSIDADLRSGAIDQAGARLRRRALERESQLYGAMDGALKFVKGDAVAGIAIVLVNVVGGLVAGLSRGLPLEIAARRYALLAIGDGLASQIPALLIAVAAGIAVTRVASEEEGGSLSGEIARQLSAEPRALWAVSALLGAVAVAPGLPGAPFALLAAAAGGTAHLLTRRRARSEVRPTQVQIADGHLLPASPLVLEVSPDLAGLAQGGGSDLLREAVPALRRRIWQELGVCLPEVNLQTTELRESGWRLLVDGVPVACGSAPLDRALVLIAPAELDLVGIPSRTAVDPLRGEVCAVISTEHASRAAALAPVRDPLARVLTSVAAALRCHAHRWVGVQEAQVLLDGLEPSAPALVREVGRQVPPALLADVLRRLLEEEVTIRPLRTILDALLASGTSQGAAALTESCRRALSRHIANRWAPNGRLEALLLDPGAEMEVHETIVGEHASLDLDAAQGFFGDLEKALRTAPRPGALLTGPDVRRAVRNLVVTRFPWLPVMSYEELPPELAIHPTGRIGLVAVLGRDRGAETDLGRTASGHRRRACPGISGIVS